VAIFRRFFILTGIILLALWPTWGTTALDDAAISSPRAHGNYVFFNGEINNTLSESVLAVGLGYNHVEVLKQIFSYNIDFRELQANDRFLVLFDKKSWESDPDNADIIAAEMVVGGKTHQRFRFKDKNDKVAYYSTKSRKGPSSAHTVTKKTSGSSFLRYPLRFKRISSPFNLRRRHPISKRIRPHKGTDFAAPRGTRVVAAADGVVIFSGRQGGYGNVVKLSHHNGTYTTVYAHLNRIHSRAKKKGARVQKNYVIGYVGTTGASTGPHLHYEFHVRKVKLPGGKTIRVTSVDKQELARFRTAAKRISNELKYCHKHYRELARVR
jgi:murein DD-endopeptidase MepM/ murein hydrolase activator NlpD